MTLLETIEKFTLAIDEYALLSHTLLWGLCVEFKVSVCVIGWLASGISNHFGEVFDIAIGEFRVSLGTPTILRAQLSSIS